MNHATHRARFTAAGAVVLGLLILIAPRILSAQQQKPLTKQEVLELLEGGVPSSRVSSIVDDRGINFTFTAAVKQQVVDAGGGDDVISSLQRASQTHAASEQPVSGGLIVKTTPGESQIYLNDEFKGMSSPEGELRLPNLSPRSYRLRVSLPGYSSNEQSIAVTAGADQTVYVTLLQKQPENPNPVRENPPPPPPVHETTNPTVHVDPGFAIPVPGVKVQGVQFFEGPHDTTLEHSQRVYRFSFDRSTTRSIFWELDLKFPTPASKIEFKVEAVWYRSDGSEMFRQTLNGFVQPPWGTSWHTLGYGWADPGHWDAGTYRVDLLCQNVKIGSGTFQVN